MKTEIYCRLPSSGVLYYIYIGLLRIPQHAENNLKLDFQKIALLAMIKSINRASCSRGPKYLKHIMTRYIQIVLLLLKNEADFFKSAPTDDFLVLLIVVGCRGVIVHVTCFYCQSRL